MGLGGISPIQLLIILAIVILIFGTKRLKSLGGDVGSAIKSFKTAMKEEEKPAEPEPLEKKSKDANFSEVKDQEKQD
ncbi:twin-arginine translocase TatA/TatE family subunit [Reinekea thalattae]|uniref:Sec-independent protein translocase protein TatA n=1 Tax=Reinekea thalattae TaxID=2593301 RepID=A0A5C8Z9M2_9GAMM|nr:twin-arginine translocase TatA/TatE family subunit [Reinekea thalattae]TXR54795.1 twin-arginine translocase TatA/TatE family subunit [Reinekea thalattae]